jgi:ribokinase
MAKKKPKPQKSAPKPSKAKPGAVPPKPAAARTIEPAAKMPPAPPPAPPPPPRPDVHVAALPSTGPGKASLAGPKSGVVVVGSLNMDLVVRTEVMPLPGQTVLGQDLLQNPGGKGANQATAAGRLWQKRSPGARLVGRIGDDLFGQNVVAALNHSKVDTSSVLVTRNMPTGTAMILVDRLGENAIVVAGGANRVLTATDLLAQRRTIETATVLVAQLEIAHDTVAFAFALAKRSNVLTILDPAPAPPEGLPESLYHVDILTPNQSEAQLLTGIAVRNVDDARRAGERLLQRGTRIVVIKMGSSGAVIVQREPRSPGAGAVGGDAPAAPPIGDAFSRQDSGPTIMQHVPGFRVQVVDATAAGDAFTGALAVGLAEGMALAQAVRFANAAGALTCTRAGAMIAIPTRAEVDALLSNV